MQKTARAQVRRGGTLEQPPPDHFAHVIGPHAGVAAVDPGQRLMGRLRVKGVTFRIGFPVNSDP